MTTQTAPATPENPLSDEPLLKQLETEAAATTVPAGAAPAAANEPAAMPTSELVKIVMFPLFGVLAPNWQVKPNEIEQLSAVYGALLDKYVPDLQTSFGIELSALMVTAAIIGPRVAMKVPRVREEKKVEKAADAPAQ